MWVATNDLIRPSLKQHIARSFDSRSLDARDWIELDGKPARPYLVHELTHLLERASWGPRQLRGVRHREHDSAIALSNS